MPIRVQIVVYDVDDEKQEWDMLSAYDVLDFTTQEEATDFANRAAEMLQGMTPEEV